MSAAAEVLTRGEEIYLEALARGCRRDRADNVSEWADTHRMLTRVSSALPGKWRTDRTPYLREPMNLLSASSPCERVSMMFGAQLGKTEGGNNWAGYIAHSAPGPMMIVQPTVDLAKAFSKQRIGPMIEATRVLRDLIKPVRSRDSGNTLLMKEFEGGLFALRGANSAAGLRSMPIRYLFGDEIDAWPHDVDGEGDPLTLAENRTATFSRRKILLTSTPTIKGISRIETEYLAGDQRRYEIPCPECGHFDFLTWNGRDWFSGTTLGSHHWIEILDRRPETARMVCGGCSARVEEGYKTQMLAAGRWKPQNPGARSASFQLSSLYSPLGWKSWESCAEGFHRAGRNKLKLKVWVNTTLGETFEETDGGVEPHSLFARVSDYEAEVPHGVGVLIGSADVQDNRVECLIKGYGAGEESWLISRNVVYGSPERRSVWADVEKFFGLRWTHASGREVAVSCVTVDSGGHHTEDVYRFCAARTSRRFFAVKGASKPGSPLLSKPSRNNAYRLPLFLVGTGTAKEIIRARLAIQDAGAGAMHFPRGGVDLEYFEQLTAEVPVTKWEKGRGAVVTWQLHTEGIPNEALDLEVYNLVGLKILGEPYVRKLGEVAAALSAPIAKKVVPPAPTWETLREPPKESTRRRPRLPGGWMGRLGRRRGRP